MDSASVNAELVRLRQTARWVGWIRLGAVPFAAFQVAISSGYPPGYELLAWLTTAGLALGALLLFRLSRTAFAPAAQRRLGFLALTFDAAVVSAYVLVYHFEPGTPIRQLLLIVVVEAALRYGMVGALTLAFATAPVSIVFETLRSTRFDVPYDLSNVSFQVGVQVMIALIVGWLVGQLRSQTDTAIARAAEAERLRDALGHRVDVLDAANRCSRALGSSLELDQAFAAFIRELRGLVPFDRVAIVLAEEGEARVIASAGAGAETVFPPGSSRPGRGSALEAVLEGRTLYRQDMRDERYPEEHELLELGLRCRLAAPLLLGARAIGMLSLVRTDASSFSQEEVELVTLLGRLVATAVQNIRAYEAEHETVEELRRLSALRADFVSLVSHELRTPMAAVIGSARTLQQRWRQLTPEQRESFLALIADETGRLAALISDVLDTSRIEAGTFSFAFEDVDLGELVEESVASASVGQDEVTVRAAVRAPLPHVRADRTRLRQVLANLIDNAVKYSPTGGEVEVTVRAENGRVEVAVRDAGPGIAREHQKVIFEKFGRAKAGGGAKPGTGLGLFIARSIAEAHGGWLNVDSAPGGGAIFTLGLPID